MTKTEILSSLSRFEHALLKVISWGGPDSCDEKDQTEFETGLVENADIVTSKIMDTEERNLHTVMLDLDVPAKLVESSTPGHSHLYIDVPIRWPIYVELLEALVDAGILEDGYVRTSIRRGFTALRLPWLTKQNDPKWKNKR